MEEDKWVRSSFKARAALDELHTAVTDMGSYIKRLETDLHDARTRTRDAEKRATVDQKQAETMAQQAARTTGIEDACRRMLDALAGLPQKMEDASVVPSSHPPAIDLYGTYQWQAVVLAIQNLEQVLGERS